MAMGVLLFARVCGILRVKSLTDARQPMAKRPLLFGVLLLMIFSVGICIEKHSPAQSPQSGQAGTMVFGRVTSRYGPVENARVRVPGQQTYTTSDKEGRIGLQTSVTFS
jgi:hypothetical protein